MRGAALFDPAPRRVTGDLGAAAEHSTAKARTVLGWSPRPVEDTIEDCARSLLARTAG